MGDERCPTLSFEEQHVPKPRASGKSSRLTSPGSACDDPSPRGVIAEFRDTDFSGYATPKGDRRLYPRVIICDAIRRNPSRQVRSRRLLGENIVSIRFGEVQKGSGLDVGAKAMILPIHGSNIIKVFGAADLSLFDDRGILTIKELDAAAALSDKFVVYGFAAALNMGDPAEVAAIQLKMAIEMGLQLAGTPKFFQIIGKALGGAAGTTVRIARDRKATAEESLQVVVLRPRPLKLSIRPVQVRNDKGNLVFHCERNYDAKALLSRINAVWTPQANIVFSAASFDPAPLDDQNAIAKATGNTSPKATVPPIIEFDDFSEMFQKLRDKETPKGDFTIFLVHRLTHGGIATFGTTSQKGGFALVSDDGRDDDQHSMPHEIGHFFGTLAKGSLYDDNNTSEELLMSSGTDGRKIPFGDVIKYFNKNYN